MNSSKPTRKEQNDGKIILTQSSSKVALMSIKWLSFHRLLVILSIIHFIFMFKAFHTSYEKADVFFFQVSKVFNIFSETFRLK